MRLVVVLYETPHLTEFLLDDILDYIEENKPTSAMDFMFFENFAHVEFRYEEGEDLTDFALLLMLSFDDIEVRVF